MEVQLNTFLSGIFSNIVRASLTQPNLQNTSNNWLPRNAHNSTPQTIKCAWTWIPSSRLLSFGHLWKIKAYVTVHSSGFVKSMDWSKSVTFLITQLLLFKWALFDFEQVSNWVTVEANVKYFLVWREWDVVSLSIGECVSFERLKWWANGTSLMAIACGGSIYNSLFNKWPLLTRV